MNIWLKGYFHENFGDDLFLHIICQRYPAHRFIILTSKKMHMEEKNAEVIYCGPFFRVLNKVFRCLGLNINLRNIYSQFTDITVLIGGSLFQELPGDTNAVRRIRQKMHEKNPLYILGVNFGPYQTECYRLLCENYFSIAKDVCFRDQTSFRLFSHLVNARVSTDLVLGIENIYPSSNEKLDVCIISVMNFSDRPLLKNYDDDYQTFIIHQINYSVMHGFRVCLVSFCKTEGDDYAISRILSACDNKCKERIQSVCYNGENWKEILSLFTHASRIIATRFHSMILGLAYGIPTFPVIYHEKMYNVLKDIGCPDYGLKLEYLKNIKNTDWDHLPYLPPQDLSRLKKQTEYTFQALDAVLK